MARIQILPPETARLIAAGEVIDRPAALLRELIDNAIDAQASDIRIEIEGGGIASVLIADDGSGMDAEDLALSILPHATSKIRKVDDLLSARSLGFRGEALASIAAAADIEITTRTAEMREARRLVSTPGLPATIEATHGQAGTRILVRGLFDNFPARRQFLKRPQAEAALCRQVFVDKALAHPSTAFRLVGDGRLLLLLPTSASFKERLAALQAEPGPGLLHEIGFSGEGFEGRIVLAGPAWYRNDRRSMEVFVNRRRVQDWALLSGLDWAFEGFLPGGAHPLAYLFVEVDPALADFNIHPAKKEVRFRDPGSIRHAMTRAIRDFLARLVRARPDSDESAFSGSADRELFAEQGGLESPAEAPYGAEEKSGPGEAGTGGALPSRSDPEPARAWASLLHERPRSPSWNGDRGFGSPIGATGDPGPAGSSEGRLRYLGQAFSLFLIVERGNELYLIDQHAAHERLLFDELSKSPPSVQELLVPIAVRVDSDAEERRLAALAPAIAEAGFSLEEAGGDWQLTTLPSSLRGDPEGALRELIEGGSADPARSARAMTACRSAIKDGEELDPDTALELARRALELPEPRCPHGRPVWFKLSREELFRQVRRIV